MRDDGGKKGRKGHKGHKEYQEISLYVLSFMSLSSLMSLMSSSKAKSIGSFNLQKMSHKNKKKGRFYFSLNLVLNMFCGLSQARPFLFPLISGHDTDVSPTTALKDQQTSSSSQESSEEISPHNERKRKFQTSQESSQRVDSPIEHVVSKCPPFNMILFKCREYISDNKAPNSSDETDQSDVLALSLFKEFIDDMKCQLKEFKDPTWGQYAQMAKKNKDDFFCYQFLKYLASKKEEKNLSTIDTSLIYSASTSSQSFTEQDIQRSKKQIYEQLTRVFGGLCKTLTHVEYYKKSIISFNQMVSVYSDYMGTSESYQPIAIPMMPKARTPSDYEVKPMSEMREKIKSMFQQVLQENVRLKTKQGR